MGGGVTLNGGLGFGGGGSGQITLGSTGGSTPINSDSSAIKFGTTPLLVGVGPFPITWAGIGLSPFATPPRNIQLSLETAGAAFPGVALTPFVVLLSITAMGFTLDFFPPIPIAPPGMIVHIVAFF
jgi:hypothetical protein